MSDPVRVLLGDSSRSRLPPNILDTLVEVCVFARDVSIAHEKTVALWRELDAAEHAFAEISEQLQRFRREGESSLLDAVTEATRDEMKQHGQQAAEALGRQVEAWLAQYRSARDGQVDELRRKIDALHRQMEASLDRFVLPLRAQPVERVVHRTLEDGKTYLDTATLEVLPGLRAELQVEDTETEQPRRIRTLIGKGATLQVGTKKALLRRTEDPAHVSLDDLLILVAKVGPEEVRLELAKKAAGPVTLRVGLGLSGEAVVGRGELPDGTGNALPDEDGPTMRKLWDAMQAEAGRIIASPARSLRYALRDEPVETPAGYVNVAERIVETYRPTVRQIMAHSPNEAELTIKVEIDGRREEKWIRRDTLAEHLGAVPAKFAERLSVPEVFAPPLPPVALKAAMIETDDEPDLEDKATRAYSAIPAELLPESTEDISLTDLEVSGEIEAEASPPPPPPSKASEPSSVDTPAPPTGPRRPKS